MFAVRFAVVAGLLPGALLATSPMRVVISGPNRVVYSLDGRYCVEIHERGGNGGCLSTPTVLRLPGNSEAAFKIDRELATFDDQHRTMLLYQKNDRGAYVRLWELRLPLTYEALVSPRGDVLVPPMPIRIHEPFEQPRDVYRAYQIVYLVDAKGRVTDIRLGALLSSADVEKLHSPQWSLRIEKTTQHRIVVLRTGDAGRFQSSSQHQGMQTIEYDADRPKHH